jgi:succinate dehydrogenase / fumarate reductase cytochrome b subunit
MQAMLASPLWAALYVAGMILAVYHLANGLWTMAITWGVLVSAEAQKRAQVVALGIFLVLCFFGIHGLLGFGLCGLPPVTADNPLTAHIGG